MSAKTRFVVVTAIRNEWRHVAHIISAGAAGLPALGAVLSSCGATMTRHAGQQQQGVAAVAAVQSHEGAVCLQVVEHVDTVVYATGYVYSFPFLNEANVVAIEDNK